MGSVIAYPDNTPKYKVSGTISQTKTDYSISELEVLLNARIGSSSYFDRAMGYQDSKLRLVSFSDLLGKFQPDPQADAALLNCFDDYQGIVSLEEIRQHDLQLATRIEIRPEFNKPDWLNPLTIIVPDSSQAPYLERFMTANIREIKFVRLDDYYFPLRSIVRRSPKLKEGFRAFKDNCLFCHSLAGIGGNKGIPLLETYDYSQPSSREQFKADFSSFHGKQNADKQNIEQFLSNNQLEKIAEFLQAVKRSK